MKLTTNEQNILRRGIIAIDARGIGLKETKEQREFEDELTHLLGKILQEAQK